jgi:hypothetical protein
VVFWKFLPQMNSDPMIPDFSDYFLGNKFETTRRVSVTQPATRSGTGRHILTRRVSATLLATLLRGWAHHIKLSCLSDSASDLARGLGATYWLGVSQ